MPPTARADAALGVQLTWARGGLLAWQPAQSRTGGNIQAGLARSFRGIVPWSSTTVAQLTVPSGSLQVIGQHLSAESFVTLAGSIRDASPSMRWFAGVRDAAMAVVGAGRAVPRLDGSPGLRWCASWRPIEADLASIQERFSAAMPPVCAAGSPNVAASQLTAEVATAFVDAAARAALRHVGWRADVNDTRRSWARAARAVARALSGNAEIAASSVPDLERELGELADCFERSWSRAGGAPALRPRLRLGLPEDTDEEWWLQLELVDLDDRSRWCTAADAAHGGEPALSLAREPRFLAALTAAADTAAHRIASVLPSVDGLSARRGAAITIDEAAEVLERFEALAEQGIELLAPEGLTRRKPQLRATATPAGGGPARFGATAIVDWTLVVDDVPVDEATIERAARAGTGLIEVGGRFVRLDGADVRRALAKLAEHRSAATELDTIGLLRLAAELDEQQLASTEPGGEPAVAATGWLGDLLQGLPDANLADGVVPPGFSATLRPYQRRGLGWLQFLRQLGLGGCLADDMGLGKTPTTLAHLAGIDGPHLVLCPLSVVRNWQQEAARFVPLARVLVHHGADRARGERLVAAVASTDIVLTTYQSAARDIDALAGINWSTVVLDEAQAVKNPHTNAAKAVRRLGGGQRLALTGTPVENRLTELWAILDVVTPGLLGTEARFRQRFAAPIERQRDEAAAQALRRLTSPFLLRRTKADKSLVPDLPDKVEQVAFAPLTREQAGMYQGVVDQLLADAQRETGMRRRGLVLAALTRLKQICNHPAHALGDGSRLAGRSGKLARFDELVADLLDAGEQALVFTQFRVMGQLLSGHLRDHFGLDVPFLHGGVPKRSRDAMVDRFQDNVGSPLLLVSLKAGGTGLNLTAASRVVHYDRWWNPAVEDQATDRAWRIGQTRSVFVHKLVCQGTVEEKVSQLIDDKRALANAVVGAAGEHWLSELSTDELRDLVVLDRAAVGVA